LVIATTEHTSGTAGGHHFARAQIAAGTAALDTTIGTLQTGDRQEGRKIETVTIRLAILALATLRKPGSTIAVLVAE
jgi:hypothetical protein